MSELKVCLFGKFCIQKGETSIFEFESSKAEELLCYLLLNRERSHPRERLADLLWGGEASQQSKGYLRKTLWQLQSALDHLADAEGERMLLAQAEWLQINPECNLWLDVKVVETAFSEVKGISGRNLTQGQAGALEAAVALYKGDLLEDCYTDWCLFERERLQYLVLASLDKLMDFCEWHQDYESGLAYGERVLRYDRARERTHSRLMRLYYLAGDRTEALRQYERCVVSLREELGVNPGETIRQLYEQIRQDELEADTGYKGGQPVQADYLALDTIHTRLGYFQKALSQLQAQLQKDIRALERAMNRD